MWTRSVSMASWDAVDGEVRTERVVSSGRIGRSPGGAGQRGVGRALTRPAEGADHREAAHHDGPRRVVLDLGEVHLHGAVEEAPFERVHVAAVEAAGDEERRGGRQQCRRENRRGLLHRRQEQREEHEPAADRVAEAIEADVDERLRRAFFGRRDGRVEELVTRAEEGATEHRFAAARHDGAGKAGRHQPANRAEEERHRRRGGGDRQAEFFEHQPARRGLEDEGDQAGGRVVAGEEPHQTGRRGRRRRRPPA